MPLSLIPFLNSVTPLPSDRIISGIREAPNRSTTTPTMMMIFGDPSDEEPEEKVLAMPYDGKIRDSDPGTWVAFWTEAEAFLAEQLGEDAEDGGQ